MSRTQEWTVYIHDKGNMVHNSPGSFGSAYSYTDISSSKNVTVIVIHEISKKVVSYLNDEKTPCQQMPRTVELNTCIQDHIQNDIGCTLPWSNHSSEYPECTASGQYNRFLQTYQEIARLTERSIAERTGCRPSCQRNEFTANIVNRAERPSKPAGFFTCNFFYASGRYVEKTYYYVYDWVHLLADVGGYMGLLLGFSLLSMYDGIMSLCKMGYGLATRRRTQLIKTQIEDLEVDP